MSEFIDLIAKLEKLVVRKADLSEMKPVLISIQDFVEALERDHTTLKTSHAILEHRVQELEAIQKHVKIYSGDEEVKL